MITLDREYYVYAWFCKDWGNVPFFVGKGKCDRYKCKSGRGIQFTAIIKAFECYPQLLSINLKESDAYWAEREIKVRFAKAGFPIIDMENGELKGMMLRKGIEAMPVKNGKRVSAKTGNYMGRPSVNVPDFEKFLKKQKEGKITVNEAIKELGISRSTCYNLANERVS